MYTDINVPCIFSNRQELVLLVKFRYKKYKILVKFFVCNSTAEEEEND